MIYGTFLQSPFYWYLISGRQKTSFFVFLCFRDLMELKKDGDFSGVNIFARGPPGALESHEGAHEARMSTGGTAYPLAASPRPIPSSSVASAQSFYVSLRLGRKPYAIFFLEFSEAAAEAKPFFHLGRGLILLSRCRRRWEIAAIVVTNSSLA